MADPSSLTLNYGPLLSTTLFEYQPKLHDNITQGCKLVAYLKEKGQWREVDGGERVQVPLMHAQNSTADFYSGYGLLDTSPQDGITAAFYDWAQLSVSIAISRKEERQNSGKHKILSLLESKTKQAEASGKELLNGSVVSGRITASAASGQFLRVVGRMDSGAFGPLPLPALIDTNNSRSVSIGNINGNTYAFWRNQASSSAATTQLAYKSELNALYNNCSKGVGGNPDLCLSDQSAWEQYWSSLQQQERYMVTDQRMIDVLGGSDMLKFRGSIWVWDEVTPDTETNATVAFANQAAVGTHTVGTVFMINSKSMEYIVDSQTDFITTPFVRPENQDAKVAQILWMGCLGVNNRRKNGVLYGISKTQFT